MTTSPSPSVSPWRGVHHIGVLTHDLDETVRFYGDALGMEATPARPSPHGRHCFIKPGDSGTWGLHFFEVPGTTPPDPATLHEIPFAAVPHIAFAIAGGAGALALRERLLARGVTVTDVNSIGPIRNILFRDNNGLLLEATWDNPDGAPARG